MFVQESMTYIIATTNMKGGVGKTTLTVNLATSLARTYGKRVLVVDLDAQISATLSLMSPQDFVRCRKEKRTLRTLINQAIQPDLPATVMTQDAICRYVCTQKGLDLLPGDLDLYDDFMVSSALHKMAETAGHGSEGFEKAWLDLEQNLVSGILKPVMNDYDFIILDCAPGYNLLTRSSLVASDFYLLPAKPEPLSIAGIQLLERRIEKLRKSHESTHLLNTQLVGIVFTMAGNFLTTGRHQSQVMQRVNQDFNDSQIFKVQIPNDVKVSRAVDSFKPVVMTDPTSAGGKAFTKLAQEFIDKINSLKGIKDQSSRMSLTEMD
jgi:chromosome partitioning protein